VEIAVLRFGEWQFAIDATDLVRFEEKGSAFSAVARSGKIAAFDRVEMREVSASALVPLPYLLAPLGDRLGVEGVILNEQRLMLLVVPGGPDAPWTVKENST
jgi:hypothetical protein